MVVLRIITNDSPGLLNDAEIYKTIFEQNKINVTILIKNMSYVKHKFCDINLFLENIGSKDIKSFYPSKLNLYMPNQELFCDQSGNIQHMHYVLCKSKVALSFFLNMKHEKKFKYICLYTKFTTNIPKELTNIKKTTNQNLFVHLAGKSPLKNTPDLIYCWLTNDGFLDIDPDIKLNITCYKKCIIVALDMLKKYYNYDLAKEHKITMNDIQKNNVIHIKNITIYTSIAPYEEYVKMLTTANLSICISSKEGYGHYINESRFFETCVMVLDAPPMNELVKEKINGIVVKNPILSKSKKSLEYATYPLYNAYPNKENLKNAIMYCIKNKDKLFEMGIVGKKMYLKDRKYFQNKMTDVIQHRFSKYVNI